MLLVRRIAPLLAAVALGGCGSPRPKAQGGAVVESVGPRGAAARAGVQAGDVLLRWEAGGRSGAIRSPFDLVLAEIEEAPLRPLRLRGRRGAEELALALPPGEWRLYARPALAPGALRQYQEAQGLLGAAKAAPGLGDLARDLRASSSPLESAAALLSLGRGLAGLKRCEAAAEGLVGLSRAFQYAGARSVLASLWAISDRATAGLMRAFYRGLRRGLPKDEALKAAETGAIGSGAHPFEWAAFQLNGDWARRPQV